MMAMSKVKSIRQKHPVSMAEKLGTVVHEVCDADAAADARACRISRLSVLLLLLWLQGRHALL